MSRQARLGLARAQALIGTRFRPQGRSARLGLDCLGMAAVAYAVPVEVVPGNYRLRGDHLDALCRGLRVHFRRISRRAAIAGDLLLLEAGRGQLHLAVKSEAGFIHADSRLGVVETPGAPQWPILRAFRRRSHKKA